MKYSLLLALLACSPEPKPASNAADEQENDDTTNVDGTAEETATETEDTAVQTDTETDTDIGNEGQTEDISIDDFEEYACSLQAADAPTINLAVSEAEAGQVLMLPSRTAGFWLQREEGAEGWMTIEVADWMEVLHLNTQPDIGFEVDGADIIRERDNEVCPTELQYQMVTFHAWGSYVVHFTADGPATFWFSIVKQ